MVSLRQTQTRGADPVSRFFSTTNPVVTEAVEAQEYLKDYPEIRLLNVIIRGRKVYHDAVLTPTHSIQTLVVITKRSACRLMSMSAKDE